MNLKVLALLNKCRGQRLHKFSEAFLIYTTMETINGMKGYLNFMNNLKKSKSGQKYSAAFEKEVFNARLLKQLGADFTMAVDVLGSKFDFENSNEFLIGVYSRIAGRIAKEKKEFDYNITLPLGEMALDSTENSSLYMQKTYDYMLKQAPVIIRKMQAKQNVMLHSGNE